MNNDSKPPKKKGKNASDFVKVKKNLKIARKITKTDLKLDKKLKKGKEGKRLKKKSKKLVNKWIERGGREIDLPRSSKIGNLLKKTASTAKKKDPYDSEMSDRSFRKFDAERDMKEQAEIRQQLKRKSTKVK